MSATLIIALCAFAAALLHGSVLDAWREVLLRKSEQPSLDAELPFITVVVPARNAASTLVPLLQELNGQGYPRESYEVLVVDDHSSDGTAELVQRFAQNWSALRLLQATEGQGKKAAITLGVQEARGELILLSDADVRMGHLRLATIASYWSKEQPALLLMPVHSSGGQGVLGWVQRKEQAALQAASIGSALLGKPVLANGANLAFSKVAFRRVGGFQGDRHASGDDMFLLQRMLRQGLKVAALADPEVHVRVSPEDSWSGFFAQRLRWAGKMWAYRDSSGLLAATAALLLPWALLFASLWVLRELQLGQGALYSLSLILGAWAVYVFPILRLVQSMERKHAEALGAPEPARSDGSWSTMPALVLFSLYAPAIAIMSIFVRPLWKGRRI